ncbi:HXXEE domain-containing protein [Anaerotignum sp.]
MRVERQIKDTNPQNWPFNQVSAMYGNLCFAVLVYILPFFLPDVRFLTLAAVLFAFAEVLMHGVVFNIALRDFYNPGLITSLFGLLPVSICYFVQTWGQHLYQGTDFLLAIVWIILNYWLAFLSPICKRLLQMNSRYAFTEEEVFRAERYIKKCK